MNDNPQESVQDVPELVLTCRGTDEQMPFCSGVECPLYAECKEFGFRLPQT